MSTNGMIPGTKEVKYIPACFNGDTTSALHCFIKGHFLVYPIVTCQYIFHFQIHLFFCISLIYHFFFTEASDLPEEEPSSKNEPNIIKAAFQSPNLTLLDYYFKANNLTI